MAIRTNVYERTVDPRGIPRASFLLFSAGLALGAACESFPYARLSAKDLLCSHQWNSDRRTVESNVKAGQRQSAPVILSRHQDGLDGFLDAWIVSVASLLVFGT